MRRADCCCWRSSADRLLGESAFRGICDEACWPGWQRQRWDLAYLQLLPDLAMACVGLFVGGFGLGQIITSTNILAGRRYTEHRGSALALLNFSWSFGAMLSPLLAAWLLPRFALRGMLECFAGLFLIAVLGNDGRGAGSAGRDRAWRMLRRQATVCDGESLSILPGCCFSMAGWRPA